jgi:uncharacterized lipoprotein
MNKFSSTKNYLYALLLAVMVMLMLAGCSSTDEAAQSDSADSNMSCDENDTREECMDDIM